jgi:hypothetical protein
LDVVVGKGKNSWAQFSLDRPVLKTARDILEKHPCCQWYTMYNDAVLFAAFFVGSGEAAELGADYGPEEDGIQEEGALPGYMKEIQNDEPAPPVFDARI